MVTGACPAHVCRVVKQRTWLKEVLPGNSVSLSTKSVHNSLLFVEFYNYEFSSSTAPAQPSLKTLTNELKFVTDWHSLGVNLDLEYQQLDVIARNHKGDNKRCKTEMLDCWLHSTPTPTWEGVAEALCLMDEYAVAATIRRKYVNSTTTTEGRFSFVLVYKPASTSLS